MTWATERLDNLVTARAEAPPIVKTLGLGTLEAWGEGWARKYWEPSPELLNADGSLFGGYLAALADQILAFTAMTVVPEANAFRTTNLTIQFFRVGKGEALAIEGRVVAQTRSLISVTANIARRRDSVLLATAHAQQLLVPLHRP